MNEIEIKKAYERELKFYESMFNITMEQERTIQSKDLRRLLSLISQKKEIIEKITKMEKELLPFKERWKDLKNSSLREKVSPIMGKIATLLGKMLAQEKRNELLLKSHIEDTAKDLKKIQMGKNLYKAYQAFPENTPYFMNQKG